MLLESIRRPSSEISTIGDIYINHSHIPTCNTLEDIVRPPGIKIYGKTAIPAGEYVIEMLWWEKYKRLMPHLMNVPMFEGVFIHPLNYSKQTDGCIGVGLTNPDVKDAIFHSKETFEKIHALLMQAWNKEAICISIMNCCPVCLKP